MIARIWRGWTTPENADTYQRIVSQEVLPGIAGRNLDGYHGAYLLRRDLEGEVEFATILLFDTLEQVRAFAGDDYETAYVPPDARAVLARFDERSAHYDTLLRPHALQGGLGSTGLRGSVGLEELNRRGAPHGIWFFDDWIPDLKAAYNLRVIGE